MSETAIALPALRAPFPWFGGKRRVAHLVWERFGDCINYVEPFAGSLAVLLGRPHPAHHETVNDKDCYLSNFWRALAGDPLAVAHYADWPVNEADLHARHRWLVAQTDFREKMRTDPDFYDAKVAGWWVWGICQWIGSGWCVEPGWTGRAACHDKPRGIHTPTWQKRPNVRRGGLGVHRTHPHLGRGGMGVHALFPGRTEADVERRPHLSRGGSGVHRLQLPQSIPDISGCRGAAGRGIFSGAIKADLYDYLDALAGRLRNVRVCCGEWDRILGHSPTTAIGTTAVFLDPPYDMRVVENRDGSTVTDKLYGHHNNDLSAYVRAWAIDNGRNEKLRIALCGYEGEHKMPSYWETLEWKAPGGYGVTAEGRGKENAKRERIWFSPACLKPAPASTPVEAWPDDRPLPASLAGEQGGLWGEE